MNIILYFFINGTFFTCTTSIRINLNSIWHDKCCRKFTTFNLCKNACLHFFLEALPNRWSLSMAKLQHKRAKNASIWQRKKENFLGGQKLASNLVYWEKSTFFYKNVLNPWLTNCSQFINLTYCCFLLTYCLLLIYFTWRTG